MLDWFNIILAVMVISVALFIVNAVKKTKAEIDKQFRRTTPTERKGTMKKLVDEIRGRDIRCSRCGERSFALPGAGNHYKCDTCNQVFEGPEHISSEID